MRLQSENDLLVKEVQKLRDEKQRGDLAMPSSWNENRRNPTPPPRRIPTTLESQQLWMSPDTFRCTPNGTRVPAGTPPPDPPPLPPWPVDLSVYEKCQEPPRKVRGVMGDLQFKPRSDIMTPQEARTAWLEREVESLKELLDRQSRFPAGYWSQPFVSETARDREIKESVASMKRNAGLNGSLGSGFQHDHGDVSHQDRVSSTVHGVHPHQVRASHIEHDFHSHQDRACHVEHGIHSH